MVLNYSGSFVLVTSPYHHRPWAKKAKIKLLPSLKFQVKFTVTVTVLRNIHGNGNDYLIFHYNREFLRDGKLNVHDNGNDYFIFVV